jgi:ABC-type branched-subunit amino acid transport system substrate-binding protein
MGIMRGSATKSLILVVGLALLLTACPQQQQQRTQESGEVKTDVGVTQEACPDAVNKDNGCIFLGALSDLTKGPFAALAVPITDAQKAFWKRVNEQGGIGNAYDVNLEQNIRDNEYTAQVHVTKYDEIQPNILALAQTLGTPMTLAALPKYKKDKIVGAPASWWSGWEFEDQILESGSNYCLESMNAVDYAVDELKVKSFMTVHYPGDYGGDAANGARHAGTARKIEDKGDHVTAPNAQAGTQDAAVQAILTAGPELVILTTGPREFAEIIGKAAAGGFTGRFIGTSPTWNKGLLATASGPAIEKLALVTFTWAPWEADTPGHKAMREALGSVDPNDGYTSGWVWSYPLKQALEDAHDAGDLTRTGLVSAASKLKSVDYEGMLPTKAGLFEGGPEDTVYRENLIVKPDKAAVANGTGVSIVEELAAGPTAKAYKFDKACQEVAA